MLPVVFLLELEKSSVFAAFRNKGLLSTGMSGKKCCLPSPRKFGQAVPLCGERGGRRDIACQKDADSLAFRKGREYTAPCQQSGKNTQQNKRL